MLESIIRTIIVAAILYVVHLVLAMIIYGTILVIIDVILILLFVLFVLRTFGIRI